MTDALSAQLLAIEQQLDAGRYRPGPWQEFVRRARSSPARERAAIAGDVSRVSDKLHRRHGYRMIALKSALLAGVGATALGGAILWLGLAYGSNAGVLLAAAIWATTFEPLIKVAAGALLNVSYSYAYLFWVEPRFKMSYGSYLAAPRAARIALHLAGLTGTPLALWIVGRAARGELGFAWAACMAVFWLVNAMNLSYLAAGLAGLSRLGPVKVALTSGGVAGLELREALGL